MAVLCFTSCCSLILIDLAMNFTEKWLHIYTCIMALSLLPFSHQSPTVALSSSLSSQFFCHCDTWTMRPLPPGNLHACKCTQFFVNRIFSTAQISLQLARVAGYLGQLAVRTTLCLAIFCNCDMPFPFADSRVTNIVWLHPMCTVTWHYIRPLINLTYLRNSSLPLAHTSPIMFYIPLVIVFFCVRMN